MGVQVEELSDHLERVQVHLVHGVWAQDVGQEHWGILLHPCYRLLGQWETDTSPEEESFDRWWSSWVPGSAWLVHGEKWVGPQQFPGSLRCAKSFPISTRSPSFFCCCPLQFPVLECQVCLETLNYMVSGDPKYVTGRYWALLGPERLRG